MTAAEFRGVFKPSTRAYVQPSSFLTSVIKDEFSLPGLLCLGALGQASLLLLLPVPYAVMPAAIFALLGILSTAIQTLLASRNSFFKGIVPGRTTVQIPNASYDPTRPAEKPLFSASPAGEQLVVFHLGVRFNHPLGILSPGAGEVSKYIMKMFESLEVESKKYGCLGTSNWRASRGSSKNALMNVFYFRSVEGLHTFAHDKVHRDAWDWYNGWTKKTGYKHIGIYHETFVSAPGQWETIYDNMPPTLLGATNVKVLNEQTGEEDYVVPLVDANTAQLRSQYGRMGRTKGGHQLGA